MEIPEDSTKITPLSELFTYHIFGTPDDLEKWTADAASYSLSVTGLVDNPLELTLDNISDDFDQITRTMILQCMTRAHWGRVEVTGTRLFDVLESAGLNDKAIKAAIHGAEGFSTDLTIKEIQEKPDDFLLVHTLNSEGLTGDHGFPIRLASDEKWGYKWCKWVTGIEAVDYDFKGHYEGKRGWSDKGMRGEPV